MKIAAIIFMCVFVCGCYQTESQLQGYQTAVLVERARELRGSSPTVAKALSDYDTAVLNGDAVGMRNALNAMAKAEATP